MRTAPAAGLALLLGHLPACMLPLSGERSYCAEVSAPAGLEHASHPRGSAYQEALDEAVSHGVPGAIMAVRSPEGLWIGASGQCDLGEDVPMRAFTRSRVGSVTKLFVAVAVLQLAERGQLDLDDPIRQHLDAEVADNVVNSDRITVRQLLAHTSGLPREPMTLGSPTALHFYADDPFSDVSLQEYVEMLYGRSALFEPGRDYSYSNFGYALLGLILEHASDESHFEVLGGGILEPLGLDDTVYDPDERTPIGLARGYEDLWGDGTLADVSDWDGLHPLHTEGGIVSTAYDLTRFMDALMDGDLLSEASLAEMLACGPTSVDEPEVRYGLGVSCRPLDDKPTYGHDGLVAGYISGLYAYPEQETSVAVLVNVSRGERQQEVGRLLHERIPPLIE